MQIFARFVGRRSVEVWAPRGAAAILRRSAAALAAALLLVACQSLTAGDRAPQAKAGVIDLTHWDFAADGPVDLRGQWRFAWKQDEPAFAQTDFDDSRWETIESGVSFDAREGTRLGYGWLRLRVLLPPAAAAAAPLGVAVPPIHSASEVYLDGARLFVNGLVSHARDEPHQPNMMPRLLPLRLDPGRREIVLAVRGSNYEALQAGMLDHLRLGLVDDLRARQWRHDVWDSILLGVYGLLICFHIIIWAYRREDRSSLYFSAWCLCILLRMATGSYFFERAFSPHDVFALSLKLPYVAAALGVFTPAFYRELFPTEFPRRLIRIFNAAALAEIIYPILAPSSLYAATVVAHERIVSVSLLAACGVITVLLAVALRRRRPEALLVWCGWIPMCWGATNDIAHGWNLPVPGNRAQYGGLILILLNAVVLAIRQARAFRTAEHLSAEMQQEVEAKTLELKKKNVQLQQLDRQKTQFFQNISHEFRTPLTLIIGPLNAALNAAPGNVLSLARDQGVIMLRNSQRLLLLINQLLDLSKLEAGRMRLAVQRVDLVKMLGAAATSFESLALRKRIQFDFLHDGPALDAWLDPEKIEKVFFNLLANAFKFTGEDGKIQLRLSRHEHEAFVGVADTGVGIPPAELPYVFERFRQADASTTRQFGGTGIGLALVKEYVDLHHGRVEVESVVNQGAKFTVALPLDRDRFAPEEIAAEADAPRPAAGPDAHGGPPPAADAAGAAALATAELLEAAADGAGAAAPPAAPEGADTVLIVEDSRDMRAYLTQTLGGRFRLLEAGDGEEGLRKAQESRPDLILTDVMMPKMDGYALLRALAARPETRRIPVIVLTAKTSEDLKIEGLQEGAQDFLAKPFNPKELAARVANLLRLVHQEKEIDALNRRMRENVLKRYLPPPLVEQILAGGSDVADKPQNLPATILFADLENFVRASGELRAHEMARLLNEYLDAMIEVIFRHGGTIDKFIGDSIMVIFGAPLPMTPAQQALRAASCAVAMQQAMDRLNEQWRQRGGNALRMRIGVHHGPVVVGNFGNQRRLDYTAIGPTVNFAARIESACEPGEIYVSGEVCDYLPARTFERAGCFSLHNIEGEVTLYRLNRRANWDEFRDGWRQARLQ